MSDEDIVDSSEKSSKYNSAFDQLDRLDEIYKHINNNIRNGNFYMWNVNLDRIWAELAGDLDEDSDEEKALTTLNKEILLLNPLINSTVPSFNKLPEGYASRLSKQYLILMKKEIKLRRIQNALGKGTAWSSGDDDDFD